MIGTTQHGVDIAAIGEEDGERKVFLFSVKQGDLTRQDWDGAASQSLRPSLNQILDVYIPTKVPRRYRDLKVVVCLCLGGDIQENIRLEVEGYIGAHTTERIAFQEWNGDRLADLLVRGVLREQLLPPASRTDFRKAVAMVDQPDVAYHHFARLVGALRDAKSPKERTLAARQVYIAVWVLFVWARDAENLEAPYRTSELALLLVWDLLRHDCGRRPTQHSKAILAVYLQLVQLHLSIAQTFLTEKVFPYLETRQAIASAVPSHSALDVNLALFEILGRIAMLGAWVEWLGTKPGQPPTREALEAITSLQTQGVKLIANNPALFSPSHDRQAIDIALFLMLALKTGAHLGDMAGWLEEMVNRLDYTVRSHGRYPIVSSEYGDLIDHPSERSEEYRKDSTAGSTLIPLIGAWVTAMQLDESAATLDALIASELPHCTLQLWMPDVSSEAALYLNRDIHGLALTELPPIGSLLLDRVAEATRDERAFVELTAVVYSNWPIVLLACRHHGLPIPPQFWIHGLQRARAAAEEEAAEEAASAAAATA
jgi:hypothetical protein